jgi:hypothetical protein
VLQLSLQRHRFRALSFTPSCDDALRGVYALTPFPVSVRVCALVLMTSTKDTILRLLMRRHALIERARDAKAIALIVGTLAAGNDV